MKSQIVNKSVLFVDDDELILRLMPTLLEAKFQVVLTAKNGKEGVEKFKELKPDLVITDLVMPILNGVEMSKEIRAISKKIPIIAITAFEDEEIDRDYIDYKLSKPVDRATLFKTIDSVLN